MSSRRGRSTGSRAPVDGGVHNADRDIVLGEEIFRLQTMDRVKADEKRFLR